MVTISNYKSFEKEDGGFFYALVVQGGVEAIKSKETGQTYLTVKTAMVPCTFDESTCKSLLGQKMPGTIKKIDVEPYEYSNSVTGEIITYTQRNVYINEDDEVLQMNLEQEEVVI